MLTQGDPALPRDFKDNMFAHFCKARWTGFKQEQVAGLGKNMQFIYLQ